MRRPAFPPRRIQPVRTVVATLASAIVGASISVASAMPGVRHRDSDSIDRLTDYLTVAYRLR